MTSRPDLLVFLTGAAASCAALAAWPAPAVAAPARPASPAIAAVPPTPSAIAADKAVRASARREGLGVTAIRQAGAGELVVACGGALPRDAFLKRASLVAYAAFQGVPSLRAIVFEHAHGSARQTIRVGQGDLTAYLADRIPRDEYHRRLAYRAPTAPAAPRPAARPPLDPPPLPLPALPAPARPAGPGLPDAARPGLAPRAGQPALLLPAAGALPGPAAPIAAVAARANDVTFAWALGLGRATYDAYAVEYDHPVMPSLSLRPALWIMSGFSPLNRLNAPGGAMDGLSGALDLVGSTRPQVGPGGVALEGGLGLRAMSLLAAPGMWPAAHLRVGARWQALGLTMRYPLLNRGGDPTATWEASLGLAWAFGGPAAR